MLVKPVGGLGGCNVEGAGFAEQIVSTRNDSPVFPAGKKLISMADMGKAVVFFTNDHPGRAGDLTPG